MGSLVACTNKAAAADAPKHTKVNTGQQAVQRHGQPKPRRHALHPERRASRNASSVAAVLALPGL